MTGIFSVPMELHVMADSAEDALAIANFAPSRIACDEGTEASLFVATDDTGNVDQVE